MALPFFLAPASTDSGTPEKPVRGIAKGEKTMERGLGSWMEGWVAAAKKGVLADMHRMASGWAGKELPVAPTESRSCRWGKPDLKFPLCSRQKMGWKGFVARVVH
jgi:hypothetical protein